MPEKRFFDCVHTSIRTVRDSKSGCQVIGQVKKIGHCNPKK